MVNIGIFLITILPLPTEHWLKRSYRLACDLLKYVRNFCRTLQRAFCRSIPYWCVFSFAFRSCILSLGNKLGLWRSSLLGPNKDDRVFSFGQLCFQLISLRNSVGQSIAGKTKLNFSINNLSHWQFLLLGYCRYRRAQLLVTRSTSHIGLTEVRTWNGVCMGGAEATWYWRITSFVESPNPTMAFTYLVSYVVSLGTTVAPYNTRPRFTQVPTPLLFGRRTAIGILSVFTAWRRTHCSFFKGCPYFYAVDEICCATATTLKSTVTLPIRIMI